MESVLDPLLPAFHLLWSAAKTANRKYNVNDCMNANLATSNHNRIANGMDVQSSLEGDQNLVNNGSNQEMSVCNRDARNRSKSSANYDETVVVCTLECDHGDKFVKQIIHDGSKRTEWSRAEYVFVDWLNSDLTSQHAQRVDVTAYFCHIPISTCSDGICLWVKNLRDEGKEINIKIKIASLGRTVSKLLDGSSTKTWPNKGRLLDSNELIDAEDTIMALRRLAKLGAHIELVSAGDWMQLLTLLTDRASLQALDMKRSTNSESLSSLLQASQ